MPQFNGFYQHIFEEVIAALEVAEDISGPDTREYRRLMQAIAEEAVRRSVGHTSRFRSAS